MLKRLVNDVTQCKLLIIEDSIEQHDNSLLYSCLKARCKEPNCQIEVFLFEHSAEEIEKTLQLKQCGVAHVNYHDFYSNAQSWILSQDPPDRNTHESLLHGIVDVENGTNRVVVADSLSAFGTNLNEYGHALFSLKCKRNVLQVILLIHRELTSDESMKCLKYLSQASIRPLINQPSFKPSVSSTSIRDLCQVEIKKDSGKVILQNELYTIKNDFEVDSRVWVPEDEDALPQNNHVDVNATAKHDVTFSLQLTEREKAQKEKLVLPYTKESTESEESSKIYYEADDGDDFDDEDPDEDLEI